MSPKSLACTALLGVALFLPGCGNKTAANPTSDASTAGVVATVNGENIVQTELDSELNKMHGRQVLDHLINEKLIEQEAKRAKIKVEPTEVKSRSEDIKRSPQFQALAKQRPMTDGDLEGYILRLLYLNKLILVEIPESEKLRMYDQYREGLEQARIHHILLPADKKSDAVKIRAQIAAGESFDSLAQKWSKDDNSKNQGGDLGWMPRAAQIEDSIKKVAFTMPLNEVSEPIKTQFGWHLIKVTARKRSYEELKPDIEDRLVAMRQGQYLERLRVKADVKTKFDQVADKKPDASPTPAQ